MLQVFEQSLFMFVFELCLKHPFLRLELVNLQSSPWRVDDRKLLDRGKNLNKKIKSVFLVSSSLLLLLKFPCGSTA